MKFVVRLYLATLADACYLSGDALTAISRKLR